MAGTAAWIKPLAPAFLGRAGFWAERTLLRKVSGDPNHLGRNCLFAEKAIAKDTVFAILDATPVGKSAKAMEKLLRFPQRREMRPGKPWKRGCYATTHDIEKAGVVQNFQIAVTGGTISVSMLNVDDKFELSTAFKLY